MCRNLISHPTEQFSKLLFVEKSSSIDLVRRVKIVIPILKNCSVICERFKSRILCFELNAGVCACNQRPSHSIKMINILYKQTTKSPRIKRYSKGTCNSKLTCGEFLALVTVLRSLLVKTKLVSIKTAHARYRDNGPLTVASTDCGQDQFSLSLSYPEPTDLRQNTCTQSWSALYHYIISRYLHCTWAKRMGHVAPLVRSHMIGLLPFKSTIEQTTKTMPLALKQ